MRRNGSQQRYFHRDCKERNTVEQKKNGTPSDDAKTMHVQQKSFTDISFKKSSSLSNSNRKARKFFEPN